MNKTINVYAGWREDDPQRIGTLYSFTTRGQESFSFEFDNNWLTSSSNRFLFDYDLLPYTGRQYQQDDKPIFGIFADSCPDRWGRLLMQRREAIYASEEGRVPRKLTESDYLLGVYDEARMGGLRFKTETDGPFLSSDDRLATPPWVELRKLESAVRHIETNENLLEKKWLDQLLAPGSSLGGARPKATIRDEKGMLWIAKFPSKHDEYDIGAWEMVAHDLALLCGLFVPEAKLEHFSKKAGTFLIKRFDRTIDRRVHFSSAMTMLGKTDMDNSASYLDIAGFLRAHSADASSDLEELWKRMVFNMAISNSDDHLRNHGFILSEKGWRLSPAYDINPIPYGDQLSLQIVPGDSRIHRDLAVSSAHYYGINKNTAEKTANEIIKTVRNNWEKLSSKYGIPRQVTEYMRPAFSKL
ncbi:MAG: type II toxin-antitoxin system HipA family toxin [Eubacterium sp.]|nr:type II toxin-antitoxin system HipA family toxin [Eubacterium sp.]